VQRDQVTRACTLLRDGDRIVVSLHSDRDVSGGRARHDHLKEVSIPDDQGVQSATVDITALAGQKEQRRIHQELLEPVGLLDEASVRFGRSCI
jgi:hypothetical protein